MPNRVPRVFAVLLGLAACNSGSDVGADPIPPAVPFLLAAGMNAIDPIPVDPITGRIPTGRLGISEVDGVYELTTPIDTPFSFDILTRAEGNSGTVSASVAHALDGAVEPTGGPETLAAAGLVVTATGMSQNPPWLAASGDGFVRLTFNGSITREQVLAVRTSSPDGVLARLVRIAIGQPSAINLDAGPGGDHPDVTSRDTLYSSDSWGFGLPTIAVSGDRTSIVVYEGDRATWQHPSRYELRLQHDAATGRVTGGGSEETSPDSGHWRDHEIAALYNVLALARCGDGSVTVRLSYDRGATFGQVAEVARANWATRLVQIAMAADYSLAVVFARTNDRTAEMELVLVEGRPDRFDVHGSPTSFEFDPERVVHRAVRDATPLPFGVEWSESGDLVIGYGFTWFTTGPDRTWTSMTEFRCASRPWGGEFLDVRVDLDVIVGRDPSVSLVGGGASLRVFYAYEGPDGVRVRVSDDGGATWLPPRIVGTAGASTPTVIARRIGGETRVDLVYLSMAGPGTELRATTWSDWDTSPGSDHRLVAARLSSSAAASDPLNPTLGPLSFGFRITQVGWMGYDAVLDGEDIVVVYDEETFDAAFVCLAAPGSFATTGGIIPTGGITSPQFGPATPPPLAPGMTLTMPPPDPAHRHQLELLRISSR